MDYYHGGKYTFLRWGGFDLTQVHDSSNPQIMEFYTNPKILASFKFYVEKLLTHVNKYTNVSYADDPTIFAIESGNEMLGPTWGDMNCPASWIDVVGKHVKSLAPKKLFVDGTYGINASHLSIESVDIFSDHFYPADVSKLQGDLARVATVNKTYFAGEYDWVGGNTDDLASWFRVLENSPVATGDALWSLFGRNVPNCMVGPPATLRALNSDRL
jgi:mannan endo-1,4-beta-mannosidase